MKRRKTQIELVLLLLRVRGEGRLAERGIL